MAGDDVTQMLDHVTTALLNHDSDYLQQVSIPQITGDNYESQLETVFRYVPDGKVVERATAGFHTNVLTSAQGGSHTDYDVTYQYHFEEGWLLVNVFLRRQGGKLYLGGLHVTTLQGDLRNLYAFSLQGKSLTHWLFLATAIVIPLFCIATLITVIRMWKRLRRRIRWAIFVSLGFVGATLNWSSGAIAIQILTMGLFGAGFVRSGDFAPWMLSVYFPLGAVLFWAFRLTGRLALRPLQSEHAGDLEAVLDTPTDEP